MFLVWVIMNKVSVNIRGHTPSFLVAVCTGMDVGVTGSWWLALEEATTCSPQWLYQFTPPAVTQERQPVVNSGLPTADNLEGDLVLVKRAR